LVVVYSGGWLVAVHAADQLSGPMGATGEFVVELDVTHEGQPLGDEP